MVGVLFVPTKEYPKLPPVLYPCDIVLVEVRVADPPGADIRWEWALVTDDAEDPA
jgi:hypothetical protein